MAKPRPKYLNLIQIRLPVPGIVSILHRVSGGVLFLFIPFLLTLFEMSLESAQTFARFKTTMSHWMIKLIVIGLAWAYLHHLCAGIRHLAADLHYGLELSGARTSSYLVLAVSLALTIVVGVLIW